jgi:hypothetical protein
MKPEEVKKEKLEQELTEEELEGASGGSITKKKKETT